MRGTQGETPSPLLWLNLVCLDAPLVAIVWQELFARSARVDVSAAQRAALFATAWLIYLADRIADSFSVPAGAPTSKRQRFAQTHRPALIGALGVAGIVDLIALPFLPRWTLAAGAIVGLTSFVYLLTNHFFSRIWRVLPAKEMAVGGLFAAGVWASLAAPPALLGPLAIFAAVCILNCASIAVWELDVDAAQQRTSIATHFPKMRRLPVIGCSAVALISVGCLLVTGNRAPLVGTAIAAVLLGSLHVAPLQPDTRTALADLVLIVPLVALPFAW